jgi:hypothetical protein
MSSTNPQSEFEALVHLARRLRSRFPAVEEDALFRLIADELESFDDARLREYVPVLIEHSVVRALRSSLAVETPGR